MLSQFTDLSVTLQTVVLIIALVFYLVQCLFGYALFKFSCAVVGFVIGLLLGLYLASGPLGLSEPWPLIIGLVAGVILALLAFKLYLLGLFVLVFLLAFSLAIQIPFPQSEKWNILALIIAVAIAIIMGVLAVKLSATLIILITAIGGAMNAGTVFNQLTNYLSTPMFYWIVVGILAAIGLLLQFLMNRK